MKTFTFLMKSGVCISLKGERLVEIGAFAYLFDEDGHEVAKHQKDEVSMVVFDESAIVDGYEEEDGEDLSAIGFMNVPTEDDWEDEVDPYQDPIEGPGADVPPGVEYDVQVGTGYVSPGIEYDARAGAGDALTSFPWDVAGVGTGTWTNAWVGAPPQATRGFGKSKKGGQHGEHEK